MNHLERGLINAASLRDETRHDDLLQRLMDLASEAEEVLDVAKASGDSRVVLAALRELRETLKTLATLAVKPDDLDDDDVQVLMTALGRVLPLYPDASLALAAQLLDLGAAEVGEVVAVAARRSRVSGI
ncbi:MAG: hypothetical protein Q7J48_17420 [Nocardioides sp.]|nr:hypothetical protein [Nocardioides sp.]